MSFEFRNSFDIMPSILCFTLFNVRICLFIHYNQSLKLLLTDWLITWQPNKCWIRGNKGKHILLHIINKEKIAKKPRILFACQRKNISSANTRRSQCWLFSYKLKLPMNLLLSLRQRRAWKGFPNFMRFILAVSSIQCLSFVILFIY